MTALTTNGIDDLRMEIVKLRAECAHLEFCLRSRDEFIVDRRLWMDYIKTLPQSKAGGPNYVWDDKPQALPKEPPPA